MIPSTEPTSLSKITSREIRLASRPTGMPTEAHFSLDLVELGPLQDQQVLTRNLFMSVDPYMRGRMNEGKSCVPPFEVGRPLDGGAVGEVIESRSGGLSRPVSGAEHREDDGGTAVSGIPEKEAGINENEPVIAQKAPYAVRQPAR